MKKFTRVGVLFGLLALSTAPSVVAQSVWSVTPATPTWDATGGDIRGLHSPQSGVVWALLVGNQVRQARSFSLFYTADTGSNWLRKQTSAAQYATTVNAPMGGVETLDLFGLDAQQAWLLKNDLLLGQFLEHTATGPDHFSVVAAALPALFERVFFFSSTVGVALVRQDGAGLIPVYRTTNGGATWQPVAALPGGPSAAGTLASKQAYSLLGSHLWVAAAQGNVMHTPDAGLTWTSTPTGLDITGVAFQDAQHGLAYGTDGTGGTASTAQNDRLARTSDGGLTWTPVAPQGPFRTRAVVAVPGAPATYVSCGAYIMNGYIPYDASLSISRDAGATWQALATNEDVRYSQLVADPDGQLWLSPYYDFNPATPGPQKMFLRYSGPSLITATVAPTKAVALAAYPNPTTGLVHVPDLGGTNEEVRVYNSAGHLIQHLRLSAAQRTLDLSTAAPGLYQVVLTSATGKQYTQRILRTN